MSKFALVGNGPLSNRGCEAIVYSSIDLINQEFGNSSYLLASFADDSHETLPKEISTLSLSFSLTRWSKLWWNYRFNQALHRPENKSGFLKQFEGNLDDIQAAFSIGGDGYAIDYGHTIVDRLMIMNDYMHSKNIPVIIWGASIGPFDKEPEFEQRIAKHFSKIELIVVREPVSKKYLNDLGVCDNVCLAPDPAFSLKPEPCKLPEDIERMLLTKCIGVNLSPLIARYATNGSLEKWNVLAVKIIRQLLEEIKLPILLIPHTTFENFLPMMDDEVFLHSVYNDLTEDEKKCVLILPKGLTSQNLKWVISQVSIFIGSRTHATIAALSSYVPCIMIAYSRKAWGISEYLFQNRDWVCSSLNLDSDILIEQVKQLLNSSDKIRIQLSRTVPGLLVETQNAVKKVNSFISD